MLNNPYECLYAMWYGDEKDVTKIIDRKKKEETQ